MNAVPAWLSLITPLTYYTKQYSLYTVYYYVYHYKLGILSIFNILLSLHVFIFFFYSNVTINVHICVSEVKRGTLTSIFFRTLAKPGLGFRRLLLKTRRHWKQKIVAVSRIFPYFREIFITGVSKGGGGRVDKVVSVGVGLISTHGFESPPVQQPLKLCVMCRVA